MNRVHTAQASNYSLTSIGRKIRAKWNEKFSGLGRHVALGKTSKNYIPLESMELSEVSRKDILNAFKVTKMDKVKAVLGTTARYTTAGVAGGAIVGGLAALATGPEAIGAGALIGGGIGLAGGLYTGCLKARSLTPETKLRNRMIKLRNKTAPLFKGRNKARFTRDALLTTIEKDFSDSAMYKKENRPTTDEGWKQLHEAVTANMKEIEESRNPCKNSKNLLNKLKKLDERLSKIESLSVQINVLNPKLERLKAYQKILARKEEGTQSA